MDRITDRIAIRSGSDRDPKARSESDRGKLRGFRCFQKFPYENRGFGFHRDRIGSPRIAIRSGWGMDRDPRRSDPIDRRDPLIGSDRDRSRIGSPRGAIRSEPWIALVGSQIQKIAIRSGSDRRIYEPIHRIGDPIRSDRRITDHITQAWRTGRVLDSKGSLTHRLAAIWQQAWVM